MPAGHAEDLGLIGVFGQKQAQRLLRIGDPSGGVETRTKDIPDIRRGHVPEPETSALDERAHSGDRRAVQRLEAGPDQRAIRRAQRDDVGDRREGHELHQLVATQGEAELAEHPAREDERDARARELLIDREIAGAARIHHREAVG
jgi:hypothetical protein